MVHDSGFVLARPISNIVIRKTDLNHMLLYHTALTPSFQSTSTQFTFLIVTMSLSLRYREWS